GPIHPVEEDAEGTEEGLRIDGVARRLQEFRRPGKVGKDHRTSGVEEEVGFHTAPPRPERGSHAGTGSMRCASGGDLPSPQTARGRATPAGRPGPRPGSGGGDPRRGRVAPTPPGGRSLPGAAPAPAVPR